MRLISARLNGYRRFAEASINLDRGLLAVVGPNEAGKSSLLTALAAIEDDQQFEPSDFTRGLKGTSDDDVVVQAKFRLSAADKKLVAQHDLVGKPHFLIVGRRRDGERHFALHPEVVRDPIQRREFVWQLGKTLRNTRVKQLLTKAFAPFDGSNDSLPRETLRDLLEDLESSLNVDSEPPPSGFLKRARQVRQAVSAAGKPSTSTAPSLSKLETTFDAFLKSETAQHPREDYLEALEDRRPKFALFRPEERELASEYSTAAVGQSMPPPLTNLFELGDVDPSALQRAITDEEHGARARLEQKANAVLKKRFEWSQSAVYPRLQFDQDVLRILLPTRDTYAPIAERSDGLRAFVALCAFASLRSDEGPPILLIDEAEIHLHYDAQADLVGVFERQMVASQIIYTTHSAGCLPNDLGTGVRTVSPMFGASREDTGRSEINNSFWTKGAGFSPLMLAMGAGVLALVPTRRAVIAEGGSETILLPSMLREVAGLKKLAFQVAPGLAEVANKKLAELELEAPKVAYLVDGDQGGEKHRRRLIKAGVPTRLIVKLPKDLTLEDFITLDEYVGAVNEELEILNGEGVQIEARDFSGPGRTSQLKAWCKKKKVAVPSKVRVADHLVRRTGATGRRLVTGVTKTTQLKNAHSRVVKALGL